MSRPEMVDPYRPESWLDFFPRLRRRRGSAHRAAVRRPVLPCSIHRVEQQPPQHGARQPHRLGAGRSHQPRGVDAPAGCMGGAGVRIRQLFYIVPVGSCQVSLFRRMSWKVPRVSLLCSSLGYLLAVAGLVGGYNL